MEKVQAVIIGAGAVGLAAAAELAGAGFEVVVAEKEDSFGRHTSSRNSEVIHAGMYYPPGSLRAGLCVEGLGLLYDFLGRHGIPFRKTGKLIVATCEAEMAVLARLLETGIRNGCRGLELVDPARARSFEPRLKCLGALLSPETGIFDTHAYMSRLEETARGHGAFLLYGHELTGVEAARGGYRLEFGNGESFEAAMMVNAAGLWSDRVAALAGLDVRRLGLALHYCKGHYFRLDDFEPGGCLVYPAPDPAGVSLGIHLVLDLAGKTRFGPDAGFVGEIDYRFDESRLDDFVRSIRRYLDVGTASLRPDDCGIRPKLQGPGEPFRDFYIAEESARSLPDLVNLVGIDSPGLTASLSIARRVRRLLEGPGAGGAR